MEMYSYRKTTTLITTFFAVLLKHDMYWIAVGAYDGSAQRIALVQPTKRGVLYLTPHKSVL
jgi:hypothetical protein